MTVSGVQNVKKKRCRDIDPYLLRAQSCKRLQLDTAVHQHEHHSESIIKLVVGDKAYLDKDMPPLLVYGLSRLLLSTTRPEHYISVRPMPITGCHPERDSNNTGTVVQVKPMEFGPERILEQLLQYYIDDTVINGTAEWKQPLVTLTNVRHDSVWQLMHDRLAYFSQEQTLKVLLHLYSVAYYLSWDNLMRLLQHGIYTAYTYTAMCNTVLDMYTGNVTQPAIRASCRIDTDDLECACYAIFLIKLFRLSPREGHDVAHLCSQIILRMPQHLQFKTIKHLWALGMCCNQGLGTSTFYNAMFNTVYELNIACAVVKQDSYLLSHFKCLHLRILGEICDLDVLEISKLTNLQDLTVTDAACTTIEALSKSPNLLRLRCFRSEPHT
jgi:hypothetical protein